MTNFTHFNEDGRARMVDVSEKAATVRTATASGRIKVAPATLAKIREGAIAKGDVLGTAQIGGIMGAKRTPDLIPMCHPILLTGVDIRFAFDEEQSAIEILATAKSNGVTGVEMEALTAVSVAALTIYDMCKALQKDMVIDDIKLLTKTGGKSGDYRRPEGNR